MGFFSDHLVSQLVGCTGRCGLRNIRSFEGSGDVGTLDESIDRFVGEEFPNQVGDSGVPGGLVEPTIWSSTHAQRT